MQTADSSLPKLDLLRQQGVPTPEGRTGHGTFGKTSAHFGLALLQPFTTRNDQTLLRGPSSDLMTVGAAGKVGLGIGTRQFGNDPTDADLTLTIRPQKEH